MPKVMLVQPDYEDRALVLDTDSSHDLVKLRTLLAGSRYANPGDRFLFDSRPGDFCSINYDQWIVRLGRDFADEDEQ